MKFENKNRIFKKIKVRISVKLNEMNIIKETLRKDSKSTSMDEVLIKKMVVSIW